MPTSVLPANKLDSIKGGQVTITTPHDAVHEECYYEVGAVFTAVANGANVDLYLAVGADAPHMSGTIAVTGTCTVSFTEGAADPGGGTALIEYNRYRGSVNTSSVVAQSGAGIFTAGATVLPPSLIPAGYGPKSVGGDTRIDLEWILAINENYLIRVNNASGGPQDIAFAIGWYE